MKCTQAILIMEKARQEKMTESSKRRMLKHLRDCPECAAYQSRRQEMTAVLRELRHPGRQENEKTCGNT